MYLSRSEMSIFEQVIKTFVVANTKAFLFKMIQNASFILYLLFEERLNGQYMFDNNKNNRFCPLRCPHPSRFRSFSQSFPILVPLSSDNVIWCVFVDTYSRGNNFVMQSNS